MNVFNPFRLESGRQVRRDDALPTDTLKKHIELLDKEDRLLLELAVSAGLSHRTVAGMLGIGAGTVSRRLRRLWRRLGDPIVARLLDQRCALGPDHRQIGVERLLIGRSTTRIAADHGMSPAAVRQALGYVRTWHRLTRPGAREGISC